jgi:hypothetical protein
MDQNRQGARASYVALAVFVAAWVLLPGAVRRFNREAFVEFQAPALHLLGKSRDLATFWEKKSRSTEELVAAGRDLARINAALEIKLKGMEDVRRENIRLRKPDPLQRPDRIPFRRRPRGHARQHFLVAAHRDPQGT